MTREDLRAIITRGLTQTRGSYRLMLQLFNMPADDYKPFLTFLGKHQCKMPFFQFRCLPRAGRGDRRDRDHPGAHRLIVLQRTKVTQVLAGRQGLSCTPSLSSPPICSRRCDCDGIRATESCRLSGCSDGEVADDARACRAVSRARSRDRPILRGTGVFRNRSGEGVVHSGRIRSDAEQAWRSRYWVEQELSPLLSRPLSVRRTLPQGGIRLGDSHRKSMARHGPSSASRAFSGLFLKSSDPERLVAASDVFIQPLQAD